MKEDVDGNDFIGTYDIGSDIAFDDLDFKF